MSRSSLAAVSLPAAESIAAGAFGQCVGLVSLYLTGGSLCVLESADAFQSTPIGGYSDTAGCFGSVFVPSSLYSDYLSASCWSALSDRIASVQEGT